MEGDCPFLPFEIWCRILPHSFESVRAGLHLGLVCRAWRDESRHVEFWRVWLEARRKALLESVIEWPAMLAVLQRRYVVVPFQCTTMELIQSKIEGFDVSRGKFFGRALTVFCFEGQVDEKGERTGKGAVYYDDGDVYWGGLLDGLFHGEGRYVWSSGLVFEGSLSQSFKFGDGKLFFTDGTAFVGFFEVFFDEETETDATRGRGVWNDMEVMLFTVGNEWSPFFQSDDQPIFRLEDLHNRDVAWGVLPSLGAPVMRPMKRRQGIWEWEDRWRKENEF